MFIMFPDRKSQTSSLAWIEEESIITKFRFDELFNVDVRKIEGRAWNHNFKVNEFPLDSIVEVVALCKKWDIPLHESVLSFSHDREHVGEIPEGSYNVFIEKSKVIIRFAYNLTLIQEIKNYVPGAEWKTKIKAYAAPLDDLAEAVYFASVFGLTVEPAADELAKDGAEKANNFFEASSLLEHEPFDIPGLTMPLRPYQYAGVAYILQARRVILGDQQGLGKTVQAISAVVHDRAFPCVVVCKSKLKEVLEADFLKFYPDLKISVLSGRTSKPIPKSDVVIVNYDIVSQRLKDIRAHNYNSLIVDESHYIKNGKRISECPVCGNKLKVNSVNCPRCGSKKIQTSSHYTVQRTDATIKLSHGLPEGALDILCTGTPVEKKPEEMIRQLEAIDRLSVFGGEWKYRKRYCADKMSPDPDERHPRNLLELHRKLRENCFIRRKTRDVLKDLPPVIPIVHALDIPSHLMDQYRLVEDDAVEWFAQKARERARDMGSIGDKEYWSKRNQLENREKLVKISALRDVVSRIKYDAIISFLDDFLEDGEEKIIVFGDHIELVEGVAKKYEDIAVNARQVKGLAAQNKFQDDDACRMFVANLTSAKEGFTLTAASDVAFMEPPWVVTHIDQGVSRCYARQNDPHGAIAHFLVAPGTIDEHIYALLERDREIVNAVTDGEEPVFSEESVMNQLVKILEKRGMEK